SPTCKRQSQTRTPLPPRRSAPHRPESRIPRRDRRRRAVSFRGMPPPQASAASQTAKFGQNWTAPKRCSYMANDFLAVASVQIWDSRGETTGKEYHITAVSPHRNAESPAGRRDGDAIYEASEMPIPNGTTLLSAS